MRSVLDHLDALALLALFSAVLRDHVQLTDLVLEKVSHHDVCLKLSTSSTVMGIQIRYSLTNIVMQSKTIQSLSHQSESSIDIRHQHTRHLHSFNR